MSLQEIVDDYRARFQRRAHVELEYFRRQPTLEEAIGQAAVARFRGRKLSHQRRLKESTLSESRARLLANTASLRSATSFEELFERIDELISDISGLGELTVYDTALRIGAWLGLCPQRVYLHAGTRKGAARLGLASRAQSLGMDALPHELQALPAREAEDVLCIYKDRLRG